MDQAARIAMTSGHEYMKTIEPHLEWGGEITQNKDGTYSYTIRPGLSLIKVPLNPKGPGVVAIWHAHPTPELAPLRATELYSYPDDLDQKIPAYLITGKSRMLLYLPDEDLTPEVGEFSEYDCETNEFKQMNLMPIW